MTKIKFYGKLGKMFGAEYNLHLSSLSEFGAAMECQSKGFRGHFYAPDKIPCIAFVDGVLMDTEDMVVSKQSTRPRLIEFVPVLHGAGITEAIADALVDWGLSEGLAQGIASAVVMVATAVITSVVVEIFTPTPKGNLDSATANAALTSYFFGGRQNRAQQGQPIPIIYGELLVGSYVVQAGIKNLDSAAWNALVSGSVITSGAPVTGEIYSRITPPNPNITFWNNRILAPWIQTPVPNGVAYQWLTQNPITEGEEWIINMAGNGNAYITIEGDDKKLATRSALSLSPLGDYTVTILGAVKYGYFGTVNISETPF